jgi:hypothetical protein
MSVFTITEVRIEFVPVAQVILLCSDMMHHPADAERALEYRLPPLPSSIVLMHHEPRPTAPGRTVDAHHVALVRPDLLESEWLLGIELRVTLWPGAKVPDDRSRVQKGGVGTEAQCEGLVKGRKREREGVVVAEGTRLKAPREKGWRITGAWENGEGERGRVRDALEWAGRWRMGWNWRDVSALAY